MSILHAPQPDGNSNMEVAGPRLIAEGDLVIVYERHDSMKPVHVTAKGKYDNRFAHFKMQVCLEPGCPFCCPIYTRCLPSLIPCLQMCPRLQISLKIPISFHRKFGLNWADIQTSCHL